MDSSGSLPRIAYSFPEDTFDFRVRHPKLYFETQNGNATAIRLDGNWQTFFKRLPELGLIMASTSSGSVSMATAWGSPAFHEYPGAAELVCLESGTELCPSALSGGIAVIEEYQGMQVASFQLFDRQGEGCLKLLLTNGSDLEVFDDLVKRHGIHYRRELFGQKCETKLESAKPNTVTVRRLWNGLSRSLPDSNFPGLDGVTRRTALEVAGKDLAWRLPYWVVRQAFQLMCEEDALMSGAIRNEAVFMPAKLVFSRWGQCDCGTTWYGPLSQLTLRTAEVHDIWATRFVRGASESISLEWYDPQGRFCGSMGVHRNAEWRHHEQWIQLLRGSQ